MIENYKKEIENNNKKIIELKETIKKYYQREVEINPYNLDDIDDSKLKEILEKQKQDIALLNIIVDTEGQRLSFELNKKIDELKVTETDKTFSEYYRTGIVEIYGTEVSVDRFYMKEIEKDGKTILNFICTDERIDKKTFNTIDDREYTVKNIYPFKKSMIFYQIYLDKNLFINNRITINNEQQLSLFMKYIHNWTPEKHKMVAETMVEDFVSEL